MKGARGLPQFNLRMTKELKDWLVREAERNSRSVTGEINAILGEVKRQKEANDTTRTQATA